MSASRKPAWSATIKRIIKKYDEKMELKIMIIRKSE